jgi:uncharacterized protein YjbI with pentapeptide repeats
MIEIKRRYTGAVIFRSEKATTVKEAINEANLNRADLRGAYLSGADLSGADLIGKKPARGRRYSMKLAPLSARWWTPCIFGG